MGAGKKRIGFVLASIYTGLAHNIWPSFAKTALLEDQSLFIFPGGRLNARVESENLRNSIYSLVNTENLDGVISWSSTIQYTKSSDDFENFHSGFDPLPYVTLAHKIPGHPCVEFDAYTGMKLLTAHSIRVHGAKKIAFLHGPDFHRSALARLKGFQDALKEAGLPVFRNNPLISDPFNWRNGDKAAAQLFENRKLKPGKDFDTLIGSSDLMTFSAVNYFSEQGYHMPQDYHALGFNNSVESRLTKTPLSTVRIPYSALSSESFRILMMLLEKKRRSAAITGSLTEDILLPSELLIRESCGCRGRHFPPAEPEGGNRRKNKKGTANIPESARPEALTAMIASYLKLGVQDTDVLVAPLCRALFAVSAAGDDASFPAAPVDHFFNLLEKALPCLFDYGNDTEMLFAMVEEIFRSGLVSPPLAKKLGLAVHRTIFKVSEQHAVHTQYEKEKWNTALNSLKCELLGTMDRISLVQSLARHLPKIGINTAGIALYVDSQNSLWIGSFSPEGINLIKELSFPAKLLVPASFKHLFSRGIFMVQPLFIENQSFGYFVHNVPIYDGVIFEELRSAVSSALKGIFQLEEVIRSKQIAEQAERSNAEFLKDLENRRYIPLEEVTERIENLEKQIDNRPALEEELKQFRSLAASREKQPLKFMKHRLSTGAGTSGKKTAGKGSFINGAEVFSQAQKKGTVLYIGEWTGPRLFQESPGDEIHIASMSDFNKTAAEIIPEIIIFSSINSLYVEAVSIIRRHPVTVSVPIIMISDSISSAADIAALCQYSRLIICHRSVAVSAEFRSRIRTILEGDEILPSHTGTLIKKTILYIDQHAESSITRWKLAEAVYVNEDYLTRIFHREMGLSLWDYLNQFRIFRAANLLRETNESIQEISSRSGFQDNSYFGRVFRKIYGIPPGQLRKNQKKSE